MNKSQQAVCNALGLGAGRISCWQSHHRLTRHKVTAFGKPVNLTPTEFRLLSYLARHAGRVISHQTLLTEVWGGEYRDQIDYLHLYIRYLRQKIELDPAQPGIIKTERGVGYYLEEPRG